MQVEQAEEESNEKMSMLVGGRDWSAVEDLWVDSIDLRFADIADVLADIAVYSTSDMIAEDYKEDHSSVMVQVGMLLARFVEMGFVLEAAFVIAPDLATQELAAP